MTENQCVKHVLSISDITPGQLYDVILPRCREEIPFVKSRIPAPPDFTRKVVLLFLEPSTRTRGSNMEAVRLGGFWPDQIIGSEATSLTKKESIANTARMQASYNAGVIVARTKIEGAQKFMAQLLEEQGYNCAIHNAGDGTNQHPTQTILDLLTIDKHLGRFDDLTIGFFGDLRYGRTVHSLLQALSYRRNINVVAVQTVETALQRRYRKLFPGMEVAGEMEALIGCDVIYGSRIQEERFQIDALALAKLQSRFMFTPQLISALKEKAVIMHPMPYVNEFPPNVRRDKKIVIDDQAWCGIPTRLALLKLSFENLQARVFNPEKPEVALKEVEECNIDEYIKTRGKKKKGRYFDPIKNGTVIDHIPPGVAAKIKNFLESRDQLRSPGPVHLIDKICETEMGQKEVLILRNNFIADEIKVAIVSLSPTITFNEITKERFRKVKSSNPTMVRGFGKCLNKACITNNDPEAEAQFVHYERGLKCFFCENEFTRDQVI